MSATQNKGRFSSGPMSDKHKEMISEGQKERWRRIHAQQLEAPKPDRKKCSTCGEWKRLDWEDFSLSEFAMRRRENKSGTISINPSSECRECKRKKSAAWRESKRESGEMADLVRKWNANRDPERRRAYQREYQALQRRRAGAEPRGPWKRYRDPKGKHAAMVPVGPFQEWISKKSKLYTVLQGGTERENFTNGLSFLAAVCEINERLLRKFLVGREIDKNGNERQVEKVSVELVDRCLVNEGSTHLHELYPHLYT